MTSCSTVMIPSYKALVFLGTPILYSYYIFIELGYNYLRITEQYQKLEVGAMHILHIHTENCFNKYINKL